MTAKTEPDFYVLRLRSPRNVTVYGPGDLVGHPMTEAEWLDGKVQERQRVEAKGHDCFDNAVHSTFRSHRGGMQDAYHCGVCGDLLQVG